MIDEYMGKFIKSFIKRYPEINVSIESCQPKELMMKLSNGEIEIGLTVKPAILFDNKIICKDIQKEKMIVILSVNNPLSHKKIVKLMELRNELFIFIKKERGHMPYLKDILNSKGYDIRQSIYTDQIDTLSFTIQETGGISIVPNHILSMNRKDITSLDIEDDDFYITTSFVWKRDNNNPSLKLFNESLDQILKHD